MHVRDIFGKTDQSPGDFRRSRKKVQTVIVQPVEGNPCPPLML